MTAALVAFLKARLDEDEIIACAASGSTVIGERGAWKASPTGDEWEAHISAHGDEELLVALRVELPRPPDVMSGSWGVAVPCCSDSEDPAESAMPTLVHAAHHDPARALRDVEAKRRLLADYEEGRVDLDAQYAPDRDYMGRLDGLEVALQYLATTYADHPDYFPEWRP